eukprot:scaffold6148_cov127-Cylindrotheca_fusiformis.AAC.3
MKVVSKGIVPAVVAWLRRYHAIDYLPVSKSSADLLNSYDFPRFNNLGLKDHSKAAISYDPFG